MITLEQGAQIASILQIFVIAGVIWQGYLLYRQMKADHERSRREKTVELLLEWDRNIKENTSLARRIVEELSEQECRNLVNQNEVKISKKHEEAIKKILNIACDKQLTVESEVIVLSGSEVTKLRWLVVTYLNLLESILVAWQYSIVNRDIIEYQFSYLFSPETGHSALKHLRTAFGGEKAFPAIEIFVNHLEQKRKSVLTDKAKVA